MDCRTRWPDDIHVQRGKSVMNYLEDGQAVNCCANCDEAILTRPYLPMYASKPATGENKGATEKSGERWSLAPWDAFRTTVVVLSEAARPKADGTPPKYSPNNWTKGMPWSWNWDSMMRHLTAFGRGERIDQESGKSHLWLAGCRLMMLISYEIRGIGEDDLPNGDLE